MSEETQEVNPSETDLDVLRKIGLFEEKIKGPLGRLKVVLGLPSDNSEEGRTAENEIIRKAAADLVDILLRESEGRTEGLFFHIDRQFGTNANIVKIAIVEEQQKRLKALTGQTREEGSPDLAKAASGTQAAATDLLSENEPQ